EQIERIISNIVHAPNIDEAAIYAVCSMTVKDAEYQRIFDHNLTIAMRLDACGCDVDHRDKNILDCHKTERLKGSEKIFLKAFRPKGPLMADDAKIGEEFKEHGC